MIKRFPIITTSFISGQSTHHRMDRYYALFFNVIFSRFKDLRLLIAPYFQWSNRKIDQQVVEHQPRHFIPKVRNLYITDNTIRITVESSPAA